MPATFAGFEPRHRAREPPPRDLSPRAPHLIFNSTEPFNKRVGPLDKREAPLDKTPFFNQSGTAKQFPHLEPVAAAAAIAVVAEVRGRLMTYLHRKTTDTFQYARALSVCIPL
jgi:hypothetical protein